MKEEQVKDQMFFVGICIQPEFNFHLYLFLDLVSICGTWYWVSIYGVDGKFPLFNFDS